jgi:hypothetical protein
VTVFRRRNRKRDEDTAASSEQAPGQQAVDTAPAEQPGAGRQGGPWDVADVPADEAERIDLGALRVPALEGTELRLEADEDGQITSVLLVTEGSGVAIGAFAAPRNEGIWDEVRGEIRDAVRGEGGVPREVEGPHGTELHTEVDTPDGRQALRFVGYDGPRWFLRGVFSGAAALDLDAAPVLSEALLGVVVVRGGDPMPVRDPLPLRLPREVLESQHAADEQSPEAPTLPERGPEITETR